MGTLKWGWYVSFFFSRLHAKSSTPPQGLTCLAERPQPFRGLLPELRTQLDPISSYPFFTLLHMHWNIPGVSCHVISLLLQRNLVCRHDFYFLYMSALDTTGWLRHRGALCIPSLAKLQSLGHDATGIREFEHDSRYCHSPDHQSLLLTRFRPSFSHSCACQL